MICHKAHVSLSRLFLAGLVLATSLILPAMAVTVAQDAVIDTIGSHVVGDRITIGGSTSLAVGDKLWVDVSSSDFHPTSKSESTGQTSGESMASGTVKVTKGTGANGLNHWSIEVDTSGWTPDEYTIKVSDSGSMPMGTATFNLGKATAVKSSTQSLTTTVVTMSAAVTTPAVTTAPAVPPTPKSPLSVIAIIGVLIAVTGFVALRGRL